MFSPREMMRGECDRGRRLLSLALITIIGPRHIGMTIFPISVRLRKNWVVLQVHIIHDGLVH